MSIRVMSAVWELDLPDSEKLIALALADWCDDDGKCWPSVAQIAAKSSKSVRTVQGTLSSLEGKGLLQRDMIAGKGTIYHLTPAAAAPRSNRAPAKSAPPQGTTQTPAAAAPNTSRTIITSEAKASSVERVRKTDPFPMPHFAEPELWADFLTNRKAKKRPNTASAHAKLLREVERWALETGWPPGDVFRVCVEEGWAGIYDPRTSKNGRSGQTGTGNIDRRSAIARVLDRDIARSYEAPDGQRTGEDGGCGGGPVARIAAV